MTLVKLKQLAKTMKRVARALKLARAHGRSKSRITRRFQTNHAWSTKTPTARTSAMEDGMWAARARWVTPVLIMIERQ